MFDTSAHNNREAGEPGQKIMDKGIMNESLNLDEVCCPPVLTGMSHELRTEINAIVAFTYLLNKKEYSDDETDEFSKHIFRSCGKIISLFDNFLDFAVIDTGNSRTEPGICNPNDVIDDLFSEFRKLLKQEEHKDLIFVSESQTFHNSDYIIDINMVTRVIRNLFEIALSNTKSGYIKLGYNLRNNRFTFYVIDSGMGYLKCKEFLQSQDLSQSLSRFNDTCTAINIALSRKLIQMMGGSVWIECNGLSGSGIYFSIPVSKAINAENTINKFSNTMSAI